eukprot:Sdes_comp17626_c0_seq1m6891
MEKPKVVEDPPGLSLEISHEFTEGSLEACQAKKISSVSQGIINILCGILGAGIVGLPQALAREGWYLGIVMIVVCGFFSGYSAILLSCCCDFILENGKPAHTLSYADLGEWAYQKPGRYASIVSQMGQSIGGAILYLLVGSDLLAGLVNWDTKYVVMVCGGCLVPLCLLKSLKEVAWVSFFGMVASILVAFVVCFDAFHNYNSEFLGKNYSLLPDGSHDVLYGRISFETVCLGFGTFAFAFGGHGIFVNIKGTLSAPKSFHLSVIISFFFCSLLYLPVSVIPYWRYGSALIGTDGNILDLMSHSVLRYAAVGCLIAHVFIAYVVFLNPIFLYVEGWCRPLFVKRKAVDGVESELTVLHILFNVAVRVFIVGFTVFVVIAVPFFSYLQSFIGATSCVMLGYILPCLFYMKLLPHRVKAHLWERCILYLILLTGVAAGGCASFFAIKGIVENLQSFNTWL